MGREEKKYLDDNENYKVDINTDAIPNDMRNYGKIDPKIH